MINDLEECHFKNREDDLLHLYYIEARFPKILNNIALNFSKKMIQSFNEFFH